MTNRIRIVSDGRVQGTKVLMPDGTPIPGVQSIELLNLDADHRDQVVCARITLVAAELDIQAEMQVERVAVQRIEDAQPSCVPTTP